MNEWEEVVRLMDSDSKLCEKNINDIELIVYVMRPFLFILIHFVQILIFLTLSLYIVTFKILVINYYEYLNDSVCRP